MASIQTNPEQKKTYRMAKKHLEKKTQTFSLAVPGATSVTLVGSFTNWRQHPIPLKRESGGLWQISVELPSRTHHYRFIVDDQWHDDPACALRVANPYGTENSVRQVP